MRSVNEAAPSSDNGNRHDDRCANAPRSVAVLDAWIAKQNAPELSRLIRTKVVGRRRRFVGLCWGSIASDAPSIDELKIACGQPNFISPREPPARATRRSPGHQYVCVK